MKFRIYTLGCKVNMYESVMMKEKLVASGYQETTDPAEIIIINTCSVTDMADAKSRKTIRQAKRENPEAITVVCGCSAENHQQDLLPLGIDILIGNKDKSNIVSLITEFLTTHHQYIKFYDRRTLPFEDMAVNSFTNQTRAYIKIQDGCNNYCTYCIIPYMRGNIRSKDINVALEECLTLVNHGHQEIVLTGIHTGSYGRGTDYDLVDLIQKMSLIPELKRIRISSIEITELNDKFLQELAINPKICNHLHIPLQSGAEAILKKMNRKYDKTYFLNKINTIRNIRPNISITTDCIVGFPGETDADFQESLEFCQSIKFSKIHVFPYSKREGTPAANMTNQVDPNIKKKRTHTLLKLSDELELAYNKTFINQNVEVLIEESYPDHSIGHTSNYLHVIIPQSYPRNTLVSVVIESADNQNCYAKK